MAEDFGNRKGIVMAGIKMELDPRSVEALNKKLRDIAARLDTKTATPLDKALMESALMLETAIKRQSSGIPVVTGRLRSSFHAKLKPSEHYQYSNNKAEVFDGALKEPIKPGEMYVVGSNVVYARSMDQKYGYMATAVANELNNVRNKLREVLKYTVEK